MVTKKYNTRKVILLCLILSISHSLYSQSLFYNTHHFGMKSTLLGGNVTAGSEDLSMVYYNPAALRHSKKKGLDSSIVQPTWSKYRFRNVLRR